jgi:gluconokinase
VLEAAALRLADVCDALGVASGSGPGPAPAAGLGSEACSAPAAEPIRLTGGILRSPFWAQLLSDVLGAPLSAVEAADASAAGAALVAQAALEKGHSLQDLAGRIRPGRRWSPDSARHETYRLLLEEFRELYRRFVDIGAAGGYADGA